MGLRLFVGLDVGDAARAELAAWAARAVGEDEALRLVPQERLHVTLAFLGSCDEALVAPLTAVVAAVAGPVGPLRLGPVLWLAPRRPHVLTVAVEGELAALHARLWAALQPLGFEPEGRSFKPHVTVARVRKGARPATLELPAPPEAQLGTTSLVLYRSHLGKAARYEPLARASLS
ncbi:RNA 2',3'-cyclic phosphodiesterase [Conexibacter sp. SYSU D00693]|uniref:RNA 2',3'-cyclic phosphodiesterase n=1 Tax=Conexibacter sp. SYSU D00693 TaxID=2812560 RepID=UPI00196B92DD|nr:RNA 2',3'-cyclic phosphodiesterase [Conexibacter sp. SYSU D00693]